jgi:DNA (cytosine-5)-methyltransferase 1
MKQERLHKAVREFYALQPPEFRADEEALMNHIHALYGEDGETSDIRMKRSDKRRTVQSSGKQPGKPVSCASYSTGSLDTSDGEVLIGKTPSSTHEDYQSGPDDDISGHPRHRKSKRLRTDVFDPETDESNSSGGENSLHATDAGSRSLKADPNDHSPADESSEDEATSDGDAFDDGTASGEEPDSVGTGARSNGSKYASQTNADDASASYSASSQDDESSEEEAMSDGDAFDDGTASGEEPDSVATGARSNGSKHASRTTADDASASCSAPSQDDESSEEEAMSDGDAFDDGTASGEEPDSVATGARSNGSKHASRTTADDASASCSAPSQDDESSEEEMGVGDAFVLTTGDGASSVEDANSNANGAHNIGPKEASGTPVNDAQANFSPPADGEACQEEPMSVGGGTYGKRNTRFEERSSQDEPIGADADTDINHKQAVDTSDSIASLDFSDDEDQDFENSQEARAEIDKVRKSKLRMKLQGLQAKRITVADEKRGDGISRLKTPPVGHLESVIYKGTPFYKGRCYLYRENGTTESSSAIVGILHLLPEGRAKCVLVVPFNETFLGLEEEDVDFQPTYKPSEFVRVKEDLPPLSLRHFVAITADDDSATGLPIDIPALEYEPQMDGACHQFGYVWHTEHSTRRGKRNKLRVADMFAGCGGATEGFHNNGFETVMAVEKDPMAVASLTTNHKVPVYSGDVREFLKSCTEPNGMIDIIGTIDHLHASPPCQGFSKANRTGGKNDATNNDLSMCFVEAVKIFRPVTATYENVLGLWDRKNQHYLKNLLVGLLKLGYQVRCTKLRACDYGDPQKRERFFIFAALKAAILPGIPHKTHGDDIGQPYVTVREALEDPQQPNSSGNNDSSRASGESMHDETETAAPKATAGDHQVQLQADSPACTVRASKIPIHYSQNRRLRVREAAALQSFPPYYVFCGDKASQFRQIGNAVPVELATAVAHSVRQSLLYYYLSNEDEAGTVLI